MVPLWGQKPEAGSYSEPKYKVKRTIGNMVPMRDGVRLSVDLYRPAANEQFPVILTHTGYSNQGGGDWFGPVRAKWFAQRGYVFAISDMRDRAVHSDILDFGCRVAVTNESSVFGATGVIGDLKFAEECSGSRAIRLTRGCAGQSSHSRGPVTRQRFCSWSGCL